jgi:hypothetical protein
MIIAVASVCATVDRQLRNLAAAGHPDQHVAAADQ